VVGAVGPGVTDLRIGDPVFGVCDQGIEGAYAEKIAIKAAIIAKKPARLGHAEAAAMALTSLTALWALEDTAKLKSGETILIQGGAGGVAGFAIQLAKHLGATVITTASARNHDYVRHLGADRVVDYTEEDFTKVVAGCDVVFDTVGGDVQVRSYAVLKPGGRLVWIAPAPAGFQPTRKDVQVLRLVWRVTARIWNGCWHCSKPARYRRRKSLDISSPMRRRLTGSAKAATCRASWFRNPLKGETDGRQWANGDRPRPKAHDCNGAKGHSDTEDAAVRRPHLHPTHRRGSTPRRA